MVNSLPADNGLIQALLERYAGMRTYRDRGVVRRKLDAELPAVELTFETAYASPDLFRFAFQSPHPFPPLKHVVSNYVVGCDGGHAYVWVQHHDEAATLEMVPDVGRAVAGATGISGGSAHTIARLLIGSVGGRRLSDLRDWTVVEDSVFDGIACHRVVGMHRLGEPWELEIERESGWLRSLSHGVGSAWTSRQMRHDIHVNEELPRDTFALPVVQ
jgi:hypothetical protein